MRKIILSFVFVIVCATVCSAQSLLYFPQIADGIQGSTQWTSALAVTDTAAPGAATANGTITFTQDNGTPLNVALFDERNSFVGSGNSFSFQITGGQTKFYFTNGAGTLSQGFATVSSNLPVTGTAVFFEGVVNGGLISQAGVVPATPLTRQAILAVQDDSVSTAVAVANPGNSTATATFQLLDTTGVSSLASVTRTVAAHNHTAFFINQLFPNLPSQFYGTLRITSDSSLVTTGLLFQTSGQFATLAVFPLQ